MSMLLGGPTFPGPRANAGRGAGRAGWWIGALLRALWAPVASADEPPAPAPDASASAPMAQITYDRTPDQAPILHFPRGSAVIQPDGEPLLVAVSAALAEHPEIPCVLIEGHSAAREVKDPVDLGLRRAEATRTALIALGVQPERLITRSRGDALPLADNNTAEGRAMNRRATLAVTPPEACSSR